MENNDLKKRTAIWLYPQTFEKMDNVINDDNFKSRSEFIEKAIDFYIGYLNTKDSTYFLSENLVTALKSTVKNTENRMANNLFRLTVEMSVMMNILAEGLEVDREQLSILRGNCIKEIKSTNGRVAFEDAMNNE